MATLIAQELTQRGIKLYLPVESNTVFCILDEEQLAKMRSEYDLSYWYADRKVVRITASFSTTAEDVEKLISTLD
jgi:threonine aldolase